MKTLHFFTAFSSDDFDDIVFEHRNKSYGAYDLRIHYGDHIKKALLLTSTFAMILACIIFYSTQRNKKSITIFPPIVDTFTYNQYDLESIKHRSHNTSSTKKTIRISHGPMTIARDTAPEPIKIDTSMQSVTSMSGDSSLFPSEGTSAGPATAGDDLMPDTAMAGDETPMIPTAWPEFPGGQDAMVRYIQRHLNCSNSGRAISGKMYLSFIVSSEGAIKNIEIIRDNVGCGEDAKRVLRGMPAWKAGTYNNRAVNVKMVIPISVEFSE